MFGDITKDFKEIEENLKKEIEKPLTSTPQIEKPTQTEEIKKDA